MHACTIQMRIDFAASTNRRDMAWHYDLAIRMVVAPLRDVSRAIRGENPWTAAGKMT